MARIALDSVDDSSIGVYVSSLDKTYSYDDRTIKWHIDGKYKSKMYLDAKVSSSDVKTFSNLSSSTTYSISAVIYKGNDVLTTLYRNVTTESRIDPFNWDNRKYSGRDFTVNMTANEWNKFTDFINEVRNANGYGNASFDRAYRGEKFYGNQYKQARSAIQGMGYGGNLPYRETGDTIYADDLNELVYQANRAIP